LPDRFNLPAFTGKTFRLEQEDAFCSNRKAFPAEEGMEL